MTSHEPNGPCRVLRIDWTHRSRAPRRWIESGITGSAILALFSWFALTACWQDPGDPYGPPPAQGTEIMYGNGFLAVTMSDGSTRFGDMQCDGQGRYRGGGNALSEDGAKATIESSIQYAKSQIEAVDRQLAQCQGKEVTRETYYAKYGCDYARRDALVAQQLKSDAAADDPALKAEVHRLSTACEQAESEYREFKDPCHAARLEQHRNNRSEQQHLLSIYESQLRQFKACVEDRRRPAQPQRTTIDPGTVMQVLPGITGGFGGRSSRGSRQSPPPSHKD